MASEGIDKTKRSKNGSEKISKLPEARAQQVSQSDLPRMDLDEALRIPRALNDQYAGQPATPLEVGQAINVQPTTGTFRMLTGASVAYGLTEGTAYAEKIALTPLGRRIVAPTEDGDDVTATREAFLKPRITQAFLTKYDGSPLPTDQIAKNVLATMGLPRDRGDEALKVIYQTANRLGMIVDINGKRYVKLQGAASRRIVKPQNGSTGDNGHEPEESIETPVAAIPPVTPRADEPEPLKPLFIGHGKKRGALEKLEKVLKEFNVPYKVAISEPNLGRPIPVKVKNLMAQCGSAILVFTKDELFRDADGNEVWRPSENVVFELGAASYAYEDRVVILKEKGLEFPSGYGNVGNIEFEEDRIESKAVDLLKELIGFKLLKLSPA